MRPIECCRRAGGVFVTRELKFAGSFSFAWFNTHRDRGNRKSCGFDFPTRRLAPGRLHAPRNASVVRPRSCLAFPLQLRSERKARSCSRAPAAAACAFELYQYVCAAGRTRAALPRKSI